MLPLSSTDSLGPSPSTCGRRVSILSHAASPPPPRSSTRLPSLSSLSLPGCPPAASSSSSSPRAESVSSPPPAPAPPLIHPQPIHPVIVQQSPLLAGSPSPTLRRDAARISPADVYAHAYQLLRERWAGAGSDVREAAEQAREALQAQEERKRRASLEQDEDLDEHRGAERAKRRRASGLVGPWAEDGAFFDNARPSLSSATLAIEGDVEIVGIPRTTSLPPLAAVFAAELAWLPGAPVASPRTSPKLLKRRRSVSVPPPHHVVPTYPRGPRTSLPPVGPKPIPTSLPPALPVSVSSISTSRSLPSFPTTTATSARSQALSQVVKSFEAARASRAEGFRRFGEGVEERRRRSKDMASPVLPTLPEQWQ